MSLALSMPALFALRKISRTAQPKGVYPPAMIDKLVKGGFCRLVKGENPIASSRQSRPQIEFVEITPEGFELLVRRQSPDALVAAVRARGSDAMDPRDAAHEAFHAIKCGMRGRWAREPLHKALCAFYEGRAADFWMHEIEARIVEGMVCDVLGVEVASLESRLALACIEALKNEMPHTKPSKAVEIAERLIEARVADSGVRAVLTLML